MKKTLDDLTPEIRAKIPLYKEKCVKDLYSGVEYDNYNREMLVRYIEKVYEIAKKDKPVIVVADDPIDYARKFKLLHNDKTLEAINTIFLRKNNPEVSVGIEEEEQQVDAILKVGTPEDVEIKSHFLFLISTYHRVYLMWYKFIQDEFGIEHKNKELLDWLYANANNNISRCYFTTMYVLVLRMPRFIRRNSVGFHNIEGPAIEWPNYGMYYVNGRKMTKALYEAVSNKTYTFDEFINETNEDVKANVITLIQEKFGNEELMVFLNATVVDEQQIQHSSGHSETVKIWKTKETFSFLSDIDGNPDQPYAWLELRCPSSGSIYLIPTSPHFKDASEACKFHRPQSIPNELRYDFTTFNN